MPKVRFKQIAFYPSGECRLMELVCLKYRCLSQRRRTWSKSQVLSAFRSTLSNSRSRWCYLHYYWLVVASNVIVESEVGGRRRRPDRVPKSSKGSRWNTGRNDQTGFKSTARKKQRNRSASPRDSATLHTIIIKKSSTWQRESKPRHSHAPHGDLPIFFGLHKPYFHLHGMGE